MDQNGLLLPESGFAGPGRTPRLRNMRNRLDEQGEVASPEWASTASEGAVVQLFDGNVLERFPEEGTGFHWQAELHIILLDALDIPFGVQYGEMWMRYVALSWSAS